MQLVTEIQLITNLMQLITENAINNRPNQLIKRLSYQLTENTKLNQRTLSQAQKYVCDLVRLLKILDGSTCKRCLGWIWDRFFNIR